MKLTKSFQSKLTEFRQALTGAAEGLRTAGRILVELLHENENAKELIASQDHIEPAFLDALERVGLNQLEPRLLLDASPAAKRAVAVALPMPQQKQLLENCVPVVVRDNGGTRVVQKKLEEITAHETARVISLEGRIRTPEEQTVILREQIERKAARSLRYTIDGDRITFYCDCTFSWSELTELCERIQPTAGEIKQSIDRNFAK